MASARVDARQVDAFEKRLQRAALKAEAEADEWEQRHGEKLVDEMQATVPVQSGNLRNSIDQVEPGGIAIGASYWRFVEYGTSRMSPRPFIRPAMKRILPAARKDAGDRAVSLIRRGR